MHSFPVEPKGIEPLLEACKATVLPLNEGPILAAVSPAMPRLDARIWSPHAQRRRSLACPEGFEPSLKVLETFVLPLHQRHINCGKSDLGLCDQFPIRC